MDGGAPVADEVIIMDGIDLEQPKETLGKVRTIWQVLVIAGSILVAGFGGAMYLHDRFAASAEVKELSASVRALVVEVAGMRVDVQMLHQGQQRVEALVDNLRSKP